MSEDVRVLVNKSCIALRKANLVTTDIRFPDIFEATGKRLDRIINEFLDAVEMLYVKKEEEIPEIVISTYNAIVDKTIDVSPKTALTQVEVKPITFERTTECFQKIN